jgi:hypothetical protein
VTRLDYATPKPEAAPTLRDAVRTCLIAGPSIFAGFTAASWLGVHIAFMAATIYLGHLPTKTGTPPSAIPFKVLAPALIAFPAAIAFPAMLGAVMLRHPRLRGRLWPQLFLPSILFGVLLLIHMADPLGARVWMFE